ncbi:RusA family crossover junction endodeoxyribonuclease [Castellaniella ginsengisoli]|uniref:RusA family crossover junction endodeoxyribonuclease n=1 Tax=Castellaniella ginsengisoli TaxID=546114 RepID=A0AB39CT84_9BURK
MTFHDPLPSMQDLAFPRSADARLAEIRARGGDKTGGAVPAQGQGQKIAQRAGNSDTGAIPAGVHFFVPGKPQGKGRPRAARTGKHIRLYTPGKTASYESTVALAASQAMTGRALFAGPVSVIMQIALPIPASWSKKKQAQAAADQLLPTTKPDADNTVKAIFDAINGVVWGDDTQVVDLLVRKRYRARPGVSVIVAPIVAREAC